MHALRVSSTRIKSTLVKFHTFIQDNLDSIVDEWEAFARTLLPAARMMSDLALRDHCREILAAIVKDMQKSARADDRSSAVRRAEAHPNASETMAAAHGALRHAAGFDMVQLMSEFRALRSSVFTLWRRCESTSNAAPTIDETDRFNEAIDQALSESVERYTNNVAASRDMFLAVLGHDLRSPLQSIEMAGSLIASPELANVKQLETGRRVTRAAKIMDGLITDLLDFTRSRLGVGIPIERSECDLRRACEEALDVAKGSNPKREFTQEMSGDLRISADCSRLRQVLTNLLNNAVQHGDQESAVALRAWGEEEAIFLSVANFGKSIPFESMQSIFEPLVQVPATTSDLRNLPKTSLGLGLFIAREIVLGHDGTIDVQSSPESGTVFKIRLPRSSPDEVKSRT
jgi:signal transduction histidine kinase